jgi:hypothetical protein
MRPRHDGQVERHASAQAFGEASEIVSSVALRLFEVGGSAQRLREVVWRRRRGRGRRQYVCGRGDETGCGGGG